MKMKIFLLTASILALGCATSASDHLQFTHQHSQQKKPPVSYEQFALSQLDKAASELLFVYQELAVEGGEWEWITIHYADAVLPGVTSPVMPVSHAPPEVN